MSVAEPIRIAFCITELDPGGAESTLVQLVTRLDRSRWEPHVSCLAGEGPLVQPLQDAGIPVTLFGARSIRNVGVVWRLFKQLREFRPQLLQSFLYHANMVGRVAGKMARVPRIVAGIRVAEKRGTRRLLMDRLSNWMVDQNVCVSQSVARFSTSYSGLKPSKVLVIPNGVDIERFADAQPANVGEFGIPKPARVVLCVGRLDEQKAPQLLLTAAASVLQDRPDVHFLFVGEGPLLEDLKRQIAANEVLQDRIHFAGFRSDIPSLMKASCCLALPSLWEGMPNVVMEAMAAGLPVVASEVEGVKELIADGQAGLVFSKGSSADLADALRRVLDDQDSSTQMGLRGSEVVRENYTYSQMIKSYENLWLDLLQRRSEEVY